MRSDRGARGSTRSDDDRARDMAGAIIGPPGTPPIVLLHGAAFTHAMWLPQLDALGVDFRVIAPDLPGHGERAGERFGLDAAVD